MNNIHQKLSAVFLASVFFTLPIATVSAATSPSLGTAEAYSILAGSEVTNTGSTTVGGNVGISPGIGSTPHYTGFTSVTLGGVIHDADGAALTAQADKDVAFGALAAQSCNTDYGAVTHELAGNILIPGVYCADSFQLSNGTLTLNGSADRVWVFKSASDIVVTGSASNIVFAGGADACDLWWRAASSASFGSGSSFAGNILASTSITFAAGASLSGRALTSTGAVTLSSNSITNPICTSGGTTLPKTASALPMNLILGVFALSLVAVLNRNSIQTLVKKTKYVS